MFDTNSTFGRSEIEYRSSRIRAGVAGRRRAQPRPSRVRRPPEPSGTER